MQDSSRPATGYPVPNGHTPPPTGTAYPYQAPPPNTNTNTNPYFYYNQQQQQPFYSDRRALILRRMIVAVIAVTVIFFTILFIMWLVIRPRLPDFQIQSLSLSNFNISSTSQTVTGNWNARFQVYNPNKKMKIYYDEIESGILYKSDTLSQTRIAPFMQNTKTQSVVEASYSATEAYVDGWVVSGINGERSRGSVGFNVKVVADVGFKVGGLRARRRLLRVLCENVPVGVSTSSKSGNLTGGARDCRVYA
ncbi:hypothetical protein K2173_020978 [Erythroxylum novogranatense]|uniref:Late embryogenesis abundant protein LEA-2 subgroup domain-containing protein n=1 Tax=Erythroxylum novogranatense TaxID=1862640 RepID=A0AAV8TPB6_9ROSI|nr:hypothetical protein K2173_020978 [Erythroxylum novogranatense]